MSLIQHKNVQIRFNQQAENSENFVLPFIAQTQKISSSTRVFEVGCAEGGVLVPFLKKGCFCLGVDLASVRIETAKSFLKEYLDKNSLALLAKNIYDEDFVQEYKNSFDVIILKDVIEHVPQQDVFINHLKKFLRKDGQIFFGFPPWHMPFGGHQQICEGKLASKLPYYHILPKPIYKSLLKALGESEGTIIALEEIWDTSITIGQFEKYIKDASLNVINKQHYLINPIYKYKFGLKPRKQWRFINHIPYLRNFITTCVYYTVQ